MAIFRAREIHPPKVWFMNRSLLIAFSVDSKRSDREAMKYLPGRQGLAETSLEAVLLDLMETHSDLLNHEPKTESTVATVGRLFKGNGGSLRS